MCVRAIVYAILLVSDFFFRQKKNKESNEDTVFLFASHRYSYASATHRTGTNIQYAKRTLFSAFLLSSSSFARRFASCFASVKFHIDTRRFQSSAEVELKPVYMFDFYEMLSSADGDA